MIGAYTKYGSSNLNDFLLQTVLKKTDTYLNRTKSNDQYLNSSYSCIFRTDLYQIKFRFCSFLNFVDLFFHFKLKFLDLVVMLKYATSLLPHCL